MTRTVRGRWCEVHAHAVQPPPPSKSNSLRPQQPLPPPSLQPGRLRLPLLPPLGSQLTVLGAVHRESHTVFVLDVTASFRSHKALSCHPCCSRCQSFLFLRQMIFHRMSAPRAVHPLATMDNGRSPSCERGCTVPPGDLLSFPWEVHPEQSCRATQASSSTLRNLLHPPVLLLGSSIDV